MGTMRQEVGHGMLRREFKPLTVKLKFYHRSAILTNPCSAGYTGAEMISLTEVGSWSFRTGEDQHLDCLIT